MDKNNKTPREVKTHGVSDEDMQYLVDLADREFAAFLQSIVVPQSLNDQQINNL